MRSEKIIFLLTALLLICSAGSVTRAQVTITGNISTYVDNFISTLPSTYGGNEYQPPSTANLSTWGNIISNILLGNYATAHSVAGGIGYRLLEYTDNSVSPVKKYYVLEKKSTSTNYWGMFIFNPSSVRKRLFIQAPHPKYDSYTGKQGFYIFKELGCAAFFVSGTHRCNSSTASACDGTSSVCTDIEEAYKISDQAHTVTGTLQKSTEILRNSVPGLFIIQPHGFSQSTGDPDIILSNGTRYTPSTDYAVQLRDNLLLTDDTLTFKIPHINTTWTKLAATENTQGRLINGSGDPCATDASSATGRFLHIEQAYALRSSDAARKKLSDALALTFPPDALTLTYPAGGQTLTAGSSINITWNSYGLTSAVKIEYSPDNGGNWNTIAAGAANTGTYAWTVPNTGTWRGKVRISDADYSSMRDSSRSYIKITCAVYPSTGLLTFVDPAAAFGPRMLSGVYDFHRGMDFPDNYNVPVHPAVPGVIVRMEDSAVTAGTSLQRNGNWILVKIDSAGGMPRHNAYLHLNGFHRFHVGDTVSTADTIGFIGKSGYGINTVHLHFELYKNLNGTLIDKDKACNPVEMLPYTNSNSYSVSFLTGNDSSAVQITTSDHELDIDGVVLYGSLAVKTIGFNSRAGIDPVNNDNPSYGGVRIDPVQFVQDSSSQKLRFWTKDSETGPLDSVKISDVSGYSLTITQAALGPRYAVTSGNWTGAIWAATPAGAAGSALTPTQLNDIIINTGVTVTVNSASAECKSVSFGSSASKLNMQTGSLLSVYGDFTLASTSHTAFSAWGSGAKVRFAGSAAVQTLSGWGTSTTYTTSFIDLVIEKTSGKVTTAGNNMKFFFGSSLDVVSGTFELAATDDIQCTDISGSGSTPVVTVRSGAVFTMAGSSSTIRSGTFTGDQSSKIGKLTVYGSVYLASANESSRRINFGGIDIENGGLVEFPTGRSTAASTFNPGIVTVKSGGTFKNSLSTTSFWYNNVTVPPAVVLQSGGTYEAAASSTTLPQGGITQNAGSMFRYSSNLATTLPAGITSYKNLILTGNGAKSLSASTGIDEMLQLSVSTVSLLTGSYTLTYSASAKLRYGSAGQTAPQTTTDAEWPANNGPKNIEIFNDGGVSLHAPRTVDGTLYLTSGVLFLGGSNLTLGSSAAISGVYSSACMIVTNGTGSLVKSVAGAAAFPYSLTFPLGDTASAHVYSPLTVTLDTAVLSGASISARVTAARHPGNTGTTHYLRRYWVLGSSGVTSLSADITALYSAADVYGSEGSLYGGRYRNSSIWKRLPKVNEVSHTITAASITAFGDITAGEFSAMGTANLLRLTCIPQGYYKPELKTTLSVSDTLTILAVSTQAPAYEVMDSARIVIDSVSYSGTGAFQYLDDGLYYIVTRGRAVMETWSAAPLQFTQGDTSRFDFTTSASKAYGSNLVLSGTKYCLYSGDVNQDGIIDFTDLSAVDNDACSAVQGYVSTDVNGDGVVNLYDLNIIDINACNFIGVLKPGQ